MNLPSNFENVSKMVESMKGKVICELGEMAGPRRESAEIAKDFITKQEDQLRLAYARREGIYPRQCILVGTSNLDDILHDPTPVQPKIPPDRQPVRGSPAGSVIRGFVVVGRDDRGPIERGAYRSDGPGDLGDLI